MIEPLLRRALDLKSRGASQTAFIISANVCGRMSVKENQSAQLRDPRRRECLNDQQIVLRLSSPASFRIVQANRRRKQLPATGRPLWLSFLTAPAIPSHKHCANSRPPEAKVPIDVSSSCESEDRQVAWRLGRETSSRAPIGVDACLAGTLLPTQSLSCVPT